MKDSDEKMWELETMLLEDGDILLAQGYCGCGDETLIRLHRSQIPLVAELGGFVPADDVARATERLQDRLSLVVSLVRSHCKPDDPLRLVVDGMFADFESKPIPGPLEATAAPLGDGCPPSIAECDSGLPANRHDDLFADKAGKLQR